MTVGYCSTCYLLWDTRTTQLPLAVRNNSVPNVLSELCANPLQCCISKKYLFMNMLAFCLEPSLFQNILRCSKVSWGFSANVQSRQIRMLWNWFGLDIANRTSCLYTRILILWSQRANIIRADFKAGDDDFKMEVLWRAEKPGKTPGRNLPTRTVVN